MAKKSGQKLQADVASILAASGRPSKLLLSELSDEQRELLDAVLDAIDANPSAGTVLGSLKLLNARWGTSISRNRIRWYHEARRAARAKKQ